MLNSTSIIEKALNPIFACAMFNMHERCQVNVRDGAPSLWGTVISKRRRPGWPFNPLQTNSALLRRSSRVLLLCPSHAISLARIYQDTLLPDTSVDRGIE